MHITSSIDLKAEYLYIDLKKKSIHIYYTIDYLILYIIILTI